MAEEIKIRVNIDGQEAEKTLQQITDDVVKFKEELSKAGEGSEDFKRLNENLKNIQTALGQTEEEFKKFTEQAVKNANSVGALRREFLDLQRQLETTEDPKQLAAIQSRLTVVGDRLETAKERVNDFQDALALRQGSGLERFRNSLGLVGEGIRNLDFAKVKVGVQGASQAFGGLGKAIAASGIGLLVLGITQLIANFDKLKTAGGFIGTLFTGIGKTVDTVVSSLKNLSDAFGLTDFAASDAAEFQKKYKESLDDTKKSIDDLILKQRELDGEISATDAQRIRAARQFQEESKKIEQERLAALAEVVDETIIIENEASRALRAANEEKRRLINQEASQRKTEAALILNQEIQDADKRDKEEKERREQKRKDDAKAAADAAKARRDARIKAENDAAIAFDAIVEENEKNRLAKEQLLEKEARKKIEEVRKIFAKQSGEEQEREQENLNKVIATINAQLLKDKLQLEIDEAKKRADALLEIEKVSLEERNKANEAYFEKQRKLYAESVESAKKSFEGINNFGLINLSERLDALEKLRTAEINDAIQRGADVKEVQEKFKKEEEDLRFASIQKTINDARTISNAFFSIQADIQAANLAALQEERSVLEANFEKRKDIIEATIQDETAKQNALDNLNKEFLASTQELDAKANELRIKQIKRDRNAALVEIGLATAEGIAKAVKAARGGDPVTLIASIIAGVGVVLAGIAKARRAIKDADASIAALGAGGGGGGLGGDIGGLSSPSAAFSSQTFQSSSFNQSEGIGPLGGPGSGFFFNPIVSVSEINEIQNIVSVTESEATFGPG